MFQNLHEWAQLYLPGEDNMIIYTDKHPASEHVSKCDVRKSSEAAKVIAGVTNAWAATRVIVFREKVLSPAM